LVPTQVVAWKRFKFLVQNGWVIEAQQELSTLPQPVSVSGQWKWIQLLSKSGQHQAATILLNRLLENEGFLRHPSYMNSVFPKDYSQWIEIEAKKYNLDPDLVRGLIRQESAFSLKAVSTSNALGLMQMIPPTAEEVSRRLKLKIQIPGDMYRPEINIPMGTFYISDMLGQFSQNVPMALGAYNAGPHRLRTWLELRSDVYSLKENHSSQPIDEIWFDELPWYETSFYIKAILRNILVYRLIDKGPVAFKPIFWSDLTLKKTDTAGSPIVK
jgi:soluble lytic murein transglycosylase